VTTTSSVVERVFIQVDDDGQFPNSSLYVAAQGFDLRGREVVRMTADEIEGRNPRPEDLVFGGVDAVRGYLGRLGCEPPELDYPERLRPFLDRSFEITTLREIRSRYNDPGPPVFIKPVQQKLFTGHTVSRFRDLIRTTEHDSTTPIYVVEHIEFVSEWRFYCEGNKVVGAGHYNGDSLQFPLPGSVAHAAFIFAKADDAPIAYGLDFGVCEDGETRLVEVNDMFALGSYGLKPMQYSHLIERRWNQLVANVVQSET
jgi:hypothetical protein